jgi:hypothetical protein
MYSKQEKACQWAGYVERGWQARRSCRKSRGAWDLTTSTGWTASRWSRNQRIEEDEFWFSFCSKGKVVKNMAEVIEGHWAKKRSTGAARTVGGSRRRWTVDIEQERLYGLYSFTDGKKGCYSPGRTLAKEMANLWKIAKSKGFF